VQLPQQAQAVAAWQQDVEHDGVERSRPRGGPRLVAVMADIHSQALRLQRLADKRGGLLVIFHNEHAHEGRLNRGDKSPTFISLARRRLSFLAAANSANLDEAYFFSSFS